MDFWLLHYAYHDKDWEAAESWFRKAIAIAPSEQRAYVELGGILLIQGKLESAREQLRNSLQHSRYPELAAVARRGLSLITEQMWSEQPMSGVADPFDQHERD
jgi:Tfp pilus assembly protein PilF